MVDFNSQRVPDPIVSPGMNLPPIGPPPSGRFEAIKNFYRNNKWYVWAIVLGIAIIGVLAYFALRPQAPEPTKNANVEVKIDAPETAPSGGEVIYKIQVENHDDAKLVNMTLEMVYPDGVSYVSSTPPSNNLSGSSFSVPDLDPGDTTPTIIIKTIAQGNVNDDKEVNARLHYRFSNFNSEFIEEASHTVRLVAADVVLDVTGPESTTNASVASYDIFYRNSSDEPIANARVRVTYPDGFTYAEADPAPTSGQNIWSLGTLNPEGTGKISYRGSFKSAQPGQSLQFKIEFEVLDNDNNYFTQAGTTYTTTISNQPLVVEQKAEGLLNDGVVAPGGNISYELRYQNNTSVVATGVSVVAQIESKAVDLSSIRAEGGQVQDNTITWNGSSVASLERLNPSESGTVRFSLSIKNPAVTDGSKNVSVITHIKIRSNENPNFLPGTDLNLKVSSPSSLSGSAGHVSGQLPPRVGQSSTFSVNLTLKNATNDYHNSVLVGYVPVGVTFDKNSLPSSEAAQVKFDASTGKLTWSMGTLAPGTRSLNFNVSFTPASNQAGQVVALFRNITFTGKDSFTAQNISLNTQNITTGSIPGNEGGGQVQL